MHRPDIEVIKKSYSTELGMKFLLLIKTKKLRNNDFLCFQTLIWCIFVILINIYEHDKFFAQLSWAWKQYLNLRTRHRMHLNSMSWQNEVGLWYQSISNNLKPIPVWASDWQSWQYELCSQRRLIAGLSQSDQASRLESFSYAPLYWAWNESRS